MLTPRKSLGLAVTDRGITAVEVGMAGGRRTVLHTAALLFSDTASLGDPDGLGRALRQTLHQNGFSASRCVVGLAASWLVAREKLLPATDADSLRNILSIAAEREFASGPQELAFDYLQFPSEKGISALLVAAPSRITEQLATMARAAGLSVTAMTSSATALALATKGPVPPSGRLVLCLLPHGVELTSQSAGGVRLIRHLPVPLDSPDGAADKLTGELRRILFLAPGAQESGQAPELVIWDSAELGSSSLEPVGRCLGLSSRLCRLASDLGVAEPSTTRISDQYAQAAALASCPGQASVIDFLHSRLAPRKQAMVGRRLMWAIGVSVVLLAACLFFLLDWQATQRKVTALQDQRAALKGRVQEAKEFVDKATFARSWYDRRPRVLDCLQEITRGFPEDGRIWATSVDIREDMQVQLSGKCVNEAAAMELIDRLNSNPRLANVKPLPISQVSGPSREWSFAINLSLRGAD